MPRRTPPLLAALLVGAIACTGDKDAPKASPVTAAELQGHLDRWCAEDRGLLPRESKAVPPAPWPDPVWPERTSRVDHVIEIRPQYHVAIDGEDMVSWLDALTPRPDGSPASWALVVSGDVNTSQVVSMAEAIAEKLGPRGVFYFAHPSVETAPAPDPARAQADLDSVNGMPPDMRATKLVSIIETRLGSCEPVVEVMTKVGQLAADERCETLAAKLPEALASCPDADHWGVMSPLYLLFTSDRTARAELAFELATAPGERVTELIYFADDDGHDEPWAEVSARWFATIPTQPVHFHRIDPALRPAMPTWGTWTLGGDTGGPTIELVLSEPNRYTLRWTKPGARKPVEATGSWRVKVDADEPHRVALLPTTTTDVSFLLINYDANKDELGVLSNLSDAALTLARARD